ncbi:MAG: tetratricopeptide repeat protein, partial [Theionarchaea archaeon]|nr:tetratricopeptide repeat protein [Theionarchaea archaeon]
YYKKSLELLESLGDKHGIASSLHQLGVLQEYQGNYKEAEKYYKESLELAESLGDKQGIARSLHQLGMLQEYQGNYKEAEKYYKESLELAENLGDKQGIAASLYQLGRIHEEQEHYEKAVKYYTESLPIALQLQVPQTEMVIKSLQRVRKAMGKAHFEHCWKAITNQEVPDYITPYKELEDFIQYILYVIDNNEHDEIEQATDTITELLKESEPDETQFLRVLLDYINRKDISKRIKKLREPYKSLLEEYLE